MGDGMLSLSWNNHSSTFCHMLSTLREMERYTDVTVACEGKFYEVHKLVLASCSDYFLKMFEKTKCKHPIVVLKDIQGKDIEALLSYMYDGVVSVAQTDLARLINAAEVLQIKGLAVPDEPPPNFRKSASTRSASDDLSGPQQKRPRREENNSSGRRQRSRDSSPLSSSRSDSSEQVMHKQNSSEDSNTNRSKQEHETREHFDNRLKNQSSENNDDNHSNKHLRPSENVDPHIKVMMDETAIKEEAQCSESGNMQENNFEFTPTTHSLDMENAGSKELGNQDLPVSFSSPPSDQSFESQAGPSGLQVWPAMHEGELSSQSYSGDMNMDSSVTGQTGSHQQQSHRMMGVINDAEKTHADRALELGNLRGFNNLHQHPHHPQYECREKEVSGQSQIYTGMKPFACFYCPYRAALKGNLRKHMRIHTGEKYSCNYCQYTTSFISNLRRHMLMMHPEHYKTS